MKPILDFLKGGVACVFGVCLITSVLMLAGFILLVIIYPIVSKILKSKKRMSNGGKPKNKENFFSRHLYKIFAAVLFVNAAIIFFFSFRDCGIAEVLSSSFIAYIISMAVGAIFYGVLLAVVSLIEKVLVRYIELKRSLKQDFEKAYAPIWISVFIGFCVFAQFLPK